MVRTLLLALLLASPIFAESASVGFPELATDPSCASGEYKVWTNTTDKKIKMCQNGSISNIGTSAYTGTAYGPGGNQYDPDRSGGTLMGVCSDEFDNGSSTGTWTWRNQSSGSITVASGTDFAQLAAGTTNNQIHARTCDETTGVDWTMTMKAAAYVPANNNSWFGLLVADGGTCASPTTIVSLHMMRATSGVNIAAIRYGTATAYTGLISGVTTDNNNRYTFHVYSRTVCMQMRYVTSTKVLSMLTSYDCRGPWTQVNTRTLSADPKCIGFAVAGDTTQNEIGFIQWIRTRTDSAGTSGEYLPGS